MEFLAYIWGNFSALTAGSAVATLAALLSAITAMVAAFLSSRSAESAPIKQEELDTPQHEVRIFELREELEKQKSVYWWSSKSATILTFLQYIIGGILASSYIKENISPQLVGFLGVLVLFSSLMHQRYRPDVFADHALKRIHQVRVLMRSIEDDLYKIEHGDEDAPTMFSLRDRASRGLADIEYSEIEGVAEISRLTRAGNENNLKREKKPNKLTSD